MKHHRKSIRLKGYNYAQAGLYFITICTHNREHLFGLIMNGKMVLNNAGRVAVKCWQDIPAHFPMATLHEYVVMPNHIHGIIEIISPKNELLSVGANDHSTQNDHTDNNRANGNSPLRITSFRSPSQSIGSIIRGFKIGVTKWVRYENGFAQNTQIWQRNYYEHIIRNDAEYNRIANYILNNPAKWDDDRFYTGY